MDKLLLNQLAKYTGPGLKVSNMVMAPDMGGDFKSDGLSYTRGDLSANVGRYSTNTGKNYYGYAGYQPLKLGLLNLGGAVGAYGPDTQNVNAIAGLLASRPLFGGDVKAVLSPGGKLMLSFDKSF